MTHHSVLSILFFNVLSLPLFTLSCLYVFSPLLYQMLFHRSSPLLLTLPILSGFTVPLHGDADACNPQVTHLFSFPPFMYLVMQVYVGVGDLGFHKLLYLFVRLCHFKCLLLLPPWFSYFFRLVYSI